MRKLPGVAPLALLLLTAPALAAETLRMPALDGSEVHIGTGVICDTQDEVQRFVSLMAEQNAGEAIQTVNREKQNPLACGVATVAFSTGKEHGDVRNSKGLYKILEIEVLAGASDSGWQEITPRRTQFTAIELPGLDV